MTEDDESRLRLKFSGWAFDEPSVRALAVVGSWARNAAGPQSDLDLILLTDDPARWTAGPQWLCDIAASLGFQPGEPALEIHGAAKSWRAWFAAAVELEVTIAALAWAGIAPVDAGTRRVVGDGIRVLVDKDGLLARVQSAL